MKKLYILIAVFFYILNTQAKVPMENKNQVEPHNLKPMSWFTDIIDGIASIWQPVWGSYSEGGSTNKSYPLACADRKYQDNIKSLIITAIVNKTDSARNIYQQIFTNANKPIVSCPSNGTCPAASIIKDAALLCVVLCARHWQR